MVAKTSSIPDDSIQSFVGDWWREDDGRQMCRGRLVWVFAPHVDQETRVLTAERAGPTQHEVVRFRVEPLRINDPPRERAPLPVAGLTEVPGEVHIIQRAKRRPAVVLGGLAAVAVDPALTKSMSKWQTAQTITVAPYYTATKGAYSSFNPEFMKRVRRAEYPQYVADWLPLPGKTTESILMLNHTQPVGPHYNSVKKTAHRLTDEALEIITDWFYWLIEGTLSENGVLNMFREDIRKVD